MQMSSDPRGPILKLLYIFVLGAFHVEMRACQENAEMGEFQLKCKVKSKDPYQI